MALPSTETYGFIKDSIAKRLNYGGYNKVNSRTAALIDEYSRSAFKQLYKSAEWISQRKEEIIDLIDDFGVYDFPDATSIYHVMEVWVTDLNGRVQDLQGGIRTNERDERITGPKGRPELWFIQDGNLNITPTPDINRWDKLHIRYTTETALVDNNTEVVIDDELMILYSLMFIYEHRGDEGRAEKLEKRIENYEPLVRAGQDESDGFQLGGHQSHIVRDSVQKRNRISDSRNVGLWGRRGWRGW